MYRSRPRSSATTSADIVFPVPESPANSTVMPRPRPPPGRIPQSSSTRSRRRARPASSRRASAVAGASTRSAQPTAGWMRRASRSRPAPFWARAPARRCSRLTVLAGQVGLEAGRLHGPIHLLAGQQELGRHVGVAEPGRSVGAQAGLPLVAPLRRTSRSACPPPAAPPGSTPVPRRPGRAAGPARGNPAKARTASGRPG